ncbi:MAG: S24 family peptidase [Nitrospirota bacterium]|nr:S24 family peptidase [Nitrospirota bacterium]
MKIERNPAMVQLADGDFTALPYVMVPDETVQTVKVRQRSLKNLLFRSEWLKKELAPDINGLAMATAHGNAMAPAIDDGDAILVDTHQKTIEKEGIYLLQVNGTIIARRIQVMMDGTLRATCDNPLYTTQIIDQAEMTAMQIVGKVVWVGKKIL